MRRSDSKIFILSQLPKKPCYCVHRSNFWEKDIEETRELVHLTEDPSKSYMYSWQQIKKILTDTVRAYQHVKENHVPLALPTTPISALCTELSLCVVVWHVSQYHSTNFLLNSKLAGLMLFCLHATNMHNRSVFFVIVVLCCCFFFFKLIYVLF